MFNTFFLAVTEFWKSVTIWRSYRLELVICFFLGGERERWKFGGGTVYTLYGCVSWCRQPDFISRRACDRILKIGYDLPICPSPPVTIWRRGGREGAQCIYYMGVCVCRGVDNLISSVDELDTGLLTALHTLELRGNQLHSAAGIDIPSLKNLFLVCREYFTFGLSLLLGDDVVKKPPNVMYCTYQRYPRVGSSHGSARVKNFVNHGGSGRVGSRATE